MKFYDPIRQKAVDLPTLKVDQLEIKTLNAEGTDSDIESKFILMNRSKVSFSYLNQVAYSFQLKFGENTFLDLTNNVFIKEKELKMQIDEDCKLLSKVQVIQLPESISLKNGFWEVDKTDIHQETEDDKWIKLPNTSEPKDFSITLKPEWQHFKFQFYNYKLEAKQAIPQFILLELKANNFGSDEVLSRSNLSMEGVMYLPYLTKTIKDKKADLYLSFSTPNPFKENKGDETVFVDARESTLAILKASSIQDLESDLVKRRGQIIDLPHYLKSDNWTVTNPDKNEGKFDLQKKTTPSTPIIFDLDSVVLTDEDLKTISWEKEYRFTIFDLSLKIINPNPLPETYANASNYPVGYKGSPVAPFYTNLELQSNFIPGNYTRTGKVPPRLVALNGVFYDVLNKRSKDGNVIGARAAVASDPEAHVKEARSRFFSAVGEYELHFLTQCYGKSGEIAVLLIYWSGKFKAGKRNGKTASNADIANFVDFGLENATYRWGHKKNKVFFKDQAKTIKVLPIFYFEGRKEEPYQYEVTIYPSIRDNVNGVLWSDYGNFGKDSFSSKVKKQYQRELKLPINDFPKQVLAHELGHAIGLKDEYAKEISNNFIIPSFDQDYYRLAYSRDPVSIMNWNEKPRVRHYWPFARWISNNKEVKNLTKNKSFVVQKKDHKTPSNAYTFSKPLKEDHLYGPMESETDVKNGQAGQFDLYLFHLGDDEFGNSKELSINSTDKQGFDSILTISSKLQWFFKDGSIKTWNDISKLNFLKDFDDYVRSRLNGNFYLERSSSGATDPFSADYNKIYLNFLPLYKVEGFDWSDHFEIEVIGDHITSPDFFKDDHQSSNLSVGINFLSGNSSWNFFGSIYNYILGLLPYTLDGSNVKQPKLNIKKEDLNFLKKWVEDKTGKKPYTIKP